VKARRPSGLAEAALDYLLRNDPYFRRNALEIVAPPLRGRPEELPALTSALLRRLIFLTTPTSFLCQTAVTIHNRGGSENMARRNAMGMRPPCCFGYKA
jgi:hypothetical protein